MKKRMNWFSCSFIILLFSAFLLVGSPQDCLAKNVKTEHFRVEYNKNDFSYADARDIANAAETAWDFYASAGFRMPKLTNRMDIRLKHKTGTSSSVPAYAVTRDRIKLFIEPSDSLAQRRLLTAHELFHQVIYVAGIEDDIREWGRLVSKWWKKSDLTGAEVQEFWLFFEGLPETMAWLAFPSLIGGAFPSCAGGEIAKTQWFYEGKLWFSPGSSSGETCEQPRLFSQPWNVLPVCGTPDSLETQAYNTIPFWLAVAQWTSSGYKHRDYAIALRKVINRIASKSKNLSITNAISSGINSRLNAFQLTRYDIRDLMSLSAGVERFHDDRSTKYRIAHFRDYETSGKDIENPNTFPSWAIEFPSIAAPNTKNTQAFADDAPVPSLNVSDGQLFETRYRRLYSGKTDSELPAFAGTLQGLGGELHPIMFDFVPPGAIEFKDRLATDSIHPVAVAGLRRDRFDDLGLDFPMRFADITKDSNGVKLALNNFRLRDLSVFRVIGHASDLKYRYTFLGKHSKPLRVSASPAAPNNPEPTRLLSLDDGEWFIRGIKPRASRYVSVMLTPAELPTAERKSKPCRKGKSSYGLWCNNQFDIVERREDSDTGEWTTLGATKRRSTYWAVVETPAPGSIDARKINARLDIARFKPGNHGGGSFFITAVNGDIETNRKPDLFVRGARYSGHHVSTGLENRHSPIGLSDALRKPFCQVSQTIEVYVTNQGTKNAPDVQVALKASFPITDSKGKSVKHRLHQQQDIPDGIRKGETKLVKFIIRDMVPLNENAYMSAKITLDPKNNVAEAMEANNVYTVPDIHFACKEKEINVPDIGEIQVGPGGILDELPPNPSGP